MEGSGSLCTSYLPVGTLPSRCKPGAGRASGALEAPEKGMLPSGDQDRKYFPHPVKTMLGKALVAEHHLSSSSQLHTLALLPMLLPIIAPQPEPLACHAALGSRGQLCWEKAVSNPSPLHGRQWPGDLEGLHKARS